MLARCLPFPYTTGTAHIFEIKVVVNKGIRYQENLSKYKIQNKKNKKHFKYKM